MFNAKQLKVKNFIENISKNAFVQSPKKWFLENSYEDCIDLLGSNLLETKINLYKFVYSEGICKNCGVNHTRLLNYHGWKGWAKTCCEACENALHSKRQMGENNSYHKLTDEVKKNNSLKQSNNMKMKILNGEFTPKSENYLLFGMINFRYNDEIRSVRSLWELIYWLQNKDLQYEKIRVKYYDSQTQKEKIYITDFYDEKTNTIVEIKPSKYQNVNFYDKKKATIEQGYNFIVVDEAYFNKCKTPELLEEIKKVVINLDKIERRLKWLKKA
jgi:hypothetical protein